MDVHSKTAPKLRVTPLPPSAPCPSDARVSPGVLAWVDVLEIQRIATEVFGDRTQVTVERVREGISTVVYRLRRDREVFYLRVLPEVGATFAPEAYVHMLLRERGVHVPEVIYLEHCNEILQRSVMVTTQIPGQHVGHLPLDEATMNILMEAGRELAIINTLQVQGFGWIKRDESHVVRLEGEQPRHRAFLLENLNRYLSVLGRTALAAHEVDAIRHLIGQHSTWLDVEQAQLAHGDVDMTHIYQENGRYTGMIDFGEVRGTGPYYDLGHFRLHDAETASYDAFPSLLAGYQQVAALPPDYEQQIAFQSLFIGIRFLARSLLKLTAYELTEHAASHAHASIKKDLELLRQGLD